MRTNPPLVSFIVPCYAAANFLPICTRSILAQTYQNFEVLIMDNCSPDNTAEVAGSFADPRVRYIRNETNIGHVRNFNKGIAHSRGKYIWNLCVDDSLTSPLILGLFVDLMEANLDVGYVFCRAIESRNGIESGMVPWADCGNEARIWDGRNFLSRLLKKNCIVLSSVMVRKECLDTVGVFPLGMPHACDWSLWCSLALHYKVAYLPEAMVSFRVHDESLTARFNKDDPRICILDKIRALCHVAQQAQLAGAAFLVQTAYSSIARHATRALLSIGRSESTPRLTESELQDFLQSITSDLKVDTKLWARILMTLGDEHCRLGDLPAARRLYWRGLRLRPCGAKNFGKLFLAVLGPTGIALRRWYASIAVANGTK